MSAYQQLVTQWKDCKLCGYCETRGKVVQARGSLPCDILFVGEAPGTSENVLGRPFVGPAGHLLDSIIERAIDLAGVPETVKISMGFVNIVGCIPLKAVGEKVDEPSLESKAACLPRLESLVALAKPKVIISVGKIAHSWISANFGYAHANEFATIVHPAAILRAPLSSQSIAALQAAVVIKDAILSLKA
jgi:uracil-DNA glycosylase family 4